MPDTARPANRVLIVDDNPVNITVLDGFVRRLGFDTLCAESGREALKIFERERPDIVLLDLMMPGMNGAEVAQQIRVLAGSHWVPIIMVSASTQEADRAFSLTQGADAYLIKPITFQALASKLAAMQRITHLQNQLEEQLAELQRYHDYIEEEQRLARSIMRHLAPEPKLHGLTTSVRPASGFSGDYLSAIERPCGKIYLILADATGHGLSAAVCLVPIFTIFEGMANKDFSIAQIAREMNLELKKRTPTDHFVAVTLVLVDRERGVTEVWNGGNPPALLLHDGQIAEVRSQHPPVGLLRDDRFDGGSISMNWAKTCSVLLISDGITDAADASGRQFGFAAVRDLFRDTAGAACDALLQRVERHLDGRPADDDMSILSLSTDYRAPEIDRAAEPGCLMHARLGPHQIRDLDMPALLEHWSRFMDWPPNLQSRIAVATTELVVNAIDHGLLHLDSSLKDGPDGMEHYFMLRSERLSRLHEGYIDITVEARPAENGREVVVSVKDSGAGFDFAPWLGAGAGAAAKFSGRGLTTVRSLSRRLSFDENGSLVKAHFFA